jgi:hypothetical protein
MAEAICVGGVSAIKSFSPSFSPLSTVQDLSCSGLVSHPALSPEAQVQILSVVDETGSATVGDVIENLPGHPAPVTAVLALVAAGALTIQPVAVLDSNARIARATGVPDEDVPVQESGSPIDGMPLPSGFDVIEPLASSPLVLTVDASWRGGARNMPMLQQPGVYLAFTGARAYVGTSENLANRIANGPHLSDFEHIAVIVDRNGILTAREAEVVERILHQMATHTGDFAAINEIPAGTSVTPQRYEALRLFVVNAMVMLRHAGVMFTGMNFRHVIAGPRAMQDTPVIPIIDRDGPIFELEGVGVNARAAQVGDDWILMRGSTIRRDVVASANSSVSIRRAEYLCSGLLREHGEVYQLISNIRFGSASAAAQFVVGSKGRSWVAVDPGPTAEPAPAR